MLWNRQLLKKTLVPGWLSAFNFRKIYIPQNTKIWNQQPSIPIRVDSWAQWLRWRFTPRQFHLFSMWCGGKRDFYPIRFLTEMEKQRRRFILGFLRSKTVWNMLKWLWKRFHQGHFPTWTEHLFVIFVCIDFKDINKWQIPVHVLEMTRFAYIIFPVRTNKCTWRALETWKLKRYEDIDIEVSGNDWEKNLPIYFFEWRQYRKLIPKCLETVWWIATTLVYDQAERLLDSEFPCVGKLNKMREGTGEIPEVLNIWIWMRGEKNWNDCWRCTKLIPNMNLYLLRLEIWLYSWGW